MNVIFADMFRALDRLAFALFQSYPRRLDETRKWRNRYSDAVK